MGVSRNFIRGGGGTPQKGPPIEKRGPKQKKLVAERPLHSENTPKKRKT